MRRAAPESRLDYVEAAMGMFHTQIHATAMVFLSHLGNEDDDFSISSWITEMSRPRARMWDAQKRHVKDFRECGEFINILCNGYILAALSQRSGYETVDQFVKALPDMSAEALSEAIDGLASFLGNFNFVSCQREKPEEQRDMQNENYILFMQQALVLRNFAVAMRSGDPGMLRVSLAFFTLWFQSSTKHKYARETLHLAACLSKLWSTRLIQYWMDNCLVNPSGKREGWMACDFLGEYVVREVQALMHNTINEKTSEFLRLTLSPLIMMFRALRKQMQDACGFYRSMHSSTVSTHEEVKKVAVQLVKEGVCNHKDGRLDTWNALDVHNAGIRILSSHNPIKEYIKQMQMRRGQYSGAELRGENEEPAGFEDSPDPEAESMDNDEDGLEFEDMIMGVFEGDDIDVDVES
jgi:hypothetical protein